MRCSTFWCAARAAALAAPLLAPAAARADSVTLTAPRAFGYVIGDTLTLDARITLDPGALLDPASLPQPHKVSSWLDLVATELTPETDGAAGRRYRLRMTYQNFFGALEPRTLEIPSWPLLVRAGGQRRALQVPAFLFVATPLRELVPSRGGNPMALQPDLPPPPYPLRADATRAGAAAGAALLGVLALALLRGWRPFRQRRRPFKDALRAMRRAGADSGGAVAYRDSLHGLHRAFDAVAGRRLLAEDVGAFLAREPRFAALAPEIARMFAASRTAFFGAGIEAAMSELPGRDLNALAARLAHAERRDPPPAPRPPGAALSEPSP